MNEQLVTDVGEKLLAYLESGESFAIEQAPLLAQEIVAYGIWHNGLISLTYLIFTIISIVLIIVLFIKKNSIWIIDTTDGALFILSVPLFVVSVFASVSAGKYFLEFLKALIAPRLYIIEQIAELM